MRGGSQPAREAGSINLLEHWCDWSETGPVNALLMIPHIWLGGHSINTSNVVLLLICLMVFATNFMAFYVRHKISIPFCRFQSDGF